jgi:hypothetical protein
MRDPDLVLVDQMLAPPPLEDARNSLVYWEERRKALPLYRRAARREAREMADRWEARVRAAQKARFDATWLGRIFASVGISTAWIQRIRVTKRGVALFAWTVVPPKLKLIAGAVVAAWLLAALAILAFTAFVFSQLLG